MTHETDTALGSMPPLEVLYRNHRGEVRKRRIIPLDTPYVGTTDWHPELGWLLRAHDVDKNAERTFACRDFLPIPDPVPGTKARTIDPSMTSDDWLRAAAAWCASDDPDTRRLGIEKLNEIADELYAGATKQTGGDEADDPEDLADRVQAGVGAARAVFEGRVSIDSLAELRRANIARDIEWSGGKADVFSLSFRGNELAGEVGEACNIIKKLDRARLGLVGSRATVDQLVEELADIVICVDLIAMVFEIDLGAAVRLKFNQTSYNRGLKTLMKVGPAVARDAVAIVQKQAELYGKWLEEDRSPRPQRGLYNRGRLDAANEILAALRASSKDDAVAIVDVIAERRRQVEAEGWTPEHDDAHGKGEMATAAACYAYMAGADDYARRSIVAEGAPYRWPWSLEWWKPTNRRRDLVKAAALIIAEIERLDRLALRASSAGERCC